MRNERVMNAKTPNELGKLTNLLACDNITIEHRKVPTASFDVKSRVLTLPLWYDMSKSLYHLLVLHEVGHALYTPEDDWMDAVTDPMKSKKLRGYINIVEDARIERMMKIKYPGSRRDFITGYKEIHDRDIFGVKYKDISTMNFIDRLNLDFKLGSSMDIHFTDDEQSFVDRCETTKTFADVVSLSEEMLAYAKDNAELGDDAFGEHADGFGNEGESSDSFGNEGESEDLGAMPGEFGEKGEGDPSDDAKPSDEPSDEGENGESDKESREEISDMLSGKSEEESADSKSEDEGSTPSSPANEGGVGYEDGVSATTDENYNKNMIDQLVDPSAVPSTYVELDKSIDYKPFIIGNAKIRDQIKRYRTCTREKSESKQWQEWDAETERRYSEFCANNKTNVAYLVKEFEMKKAADQYTRAKDAKTGVIDPNKLHSYKFSDTIFKRITVLPDAKNHGLMMYVDFSGSMAESMLGTIEQLINLVMFCRKVNIPHRVYGFTDSLCLTDQYGSWGMDIRDEFPSPLPNVGKAFKNHGRGLYLIELYTEKMNNTAFVDMTKYLLDFGGYIDFHYSRSYRERDGLKTSWKPFFFSLGGTPLNTTLLLVRDMVNDFRKETSAQIVNLVFLTDGCSHRLDYDQDYMTAKGHYDHRGAHGYRPSIIIRDPVSKIESKITYPSTETTGLLKIIRKSCDVNAVNFYISASRGVPHELWALVTRADNPKEDYELHKDKFKSMWRKDKSITIEETHGFNEVHLISGSHNLRTEGTGLEGIEVGETKGKMTKAFIKANTKRKTSRVVLRKFIDRIAA